VREWVADRYAEGGRPSIDPVVFFKLQLVIFFEGVRSERQLMRVVADRLSVRWYLGYDLDEPLPDHSSLTRIRARLGLPIFQRFFEHVVELCQTAGLVWGKELFFDATQVRANAHVDSLVPRWNLEAKAHLDELFPGNAAASDADAAVSALPTHEGEAAQLPTALPFAGSPEDEAQLATANGSAWRLLERFRLRRDRPTTRGYHRTSDDWESLTVPDAAPMKKGGPLVLGYHDHYVVDGGKARIILAAVVTPGDVMENTPMLDLLRRVCFRWKVHPRRAVGDSTYGTIENIRALEDAGSRAYVPLPDFDRRTPYFGASRFTYDPAQDRYRCPQGQPLHRRRAKYSEEVVVYRAEAATCNGCSLKEKCTPSAAGRQVRRSFHADYLEGCAPTTTPRRTRRRCASGRSGWSRSSARRRTGTGSAASASAVSGR
jgi:transposase